MAESYGFEGRCDYMLIARQKHVPEIGGYAIPKWFSIIAAPWFPFAIWELRSLPPYSVVQINTILVSQRCVVDSPQAFAQSELQTRPAL